MTNDQIQEIFRLHALWLRGCSAGRRADFSGADLYGADLSCVNLSGASLYRANLSSANLCRAELSDVNLFGANLSHVNLSGADLSGANLPRADLYDANLYDANLSCAILSNANLSGADFSGANLYRANLSCANFYGANFSCANLSGIYGLTPTMMLLANWGNLSDNLCKLAMAYDASGHADPTAFDRWKETGVCPYGNTSYMRLCNFCEKRDLWDPTVKAPGSFDLMVALIKEKCANSDWY